jgi:hypothetical protein
MQPVTSFSKAIAMLNEGKSAAEIYKLLHSVKRFKEFLPKETLTAEVKIPEPLMKAKLGTPPSIDTPEEEKKSKKAAATKENTKDISSFFTSKRPATTFSTASITLNEQQIASAEFGALQNEEGQGTASKLSSSALDR